MSDIKQRFSLRLLQYQSTAKKIDVRFDRSGASPKMHIEIWGFDHTLLDKWYDDVITGSSRTDPASDVVLNIVQFAFGKSMRVLINSRDHLVCER